VEAAFQTELHTYLVDEETHYANASEPSVPAAFGSVVKGVPGLNDFRMKARARPRNTAGRGAHYLAPDDQAIIYDISSLYIAGVNGTGQKIAVAGQTAINLSDITTFRSTDNLPDAAALRLGLAAALLAPAPALAA
jgi:subtilase family serine protease